MFLELHMVIHAAGVDPCSLFISQRSQVLGKQEGKRTHTLTQYYICSECARKLIALQSYTVISQGRPTMPTHSPEDLSHKAGDALWRAALDVVKNNFNAAEHLPGPKKVY